MRRSFWSPVRCSGCTSSSVIGLLSVSRRFESPTLCIAPRAREETQAFFNCDWFCFQQYERIDDWEGAATDSPLLSESKARRKPSVIALIVCGCFDLQGEAIHPFFQGFLKLDSDFRLQVAVRPHLAILDNQGQADSSF